MPLILPLADGRALEIKVRTSTRARHLRLVSGLGGIEAVVPPGYDEGRLAKFVESKKSWIARTARHYEKIRERTGGHEEGSLYFLGDRYRYHVIKDRLPSATISEGMKTVTFHVTDKRSYRRHIKEWYKEQTRITIAERLPAIAARMGLQYNRVTIRSQRSRWASCSKKRNLNFNLLLSAAPVEVIDYVIVHELAHILEMDHSKRFWDIVASADPGFEKHRQWLEDHSQVIRVESL